MGRLDGKVCIVTGGARGQGGAEAALFRSEGAEVVITDVLADEGAAHAAAIGATFIRHDVRSEEEWTEVVRQTVDRHGRIDVLVNNAGIYERGKLLDTTLEQYRRIIDINQVGVFLGMKAVAPTMSDQQSGSIVNISSIAGLLGAAGAVAYGASKFAVRGMTKAVALELARFNVRVNSIHPGMIETPMMDVVTGNNDERHDKMARAVPLRRPAEPEEVAALALYLASDESRYCTGSEFVIDGGITAG
ncbi:MAG: glucose 1-dehydrogenase [Acidimicrobiia bacterium]|nr:glucose 1-dehydrogenase [Acidimicrobiia bacterium]